MLRFIPITDDKYSINELDMNFYGVKSELLEYIDNDKISDYAYLGAWRKKILFLQMAAIIDALHNSKVTFSVRASEKNTMQIIYEREEYKNEIGIIINKEVSTEYNENDFPNMRKLEGAESLLKQTSRHFLRIFQAPDRNLLFVWTNQPLEFETLYKLKQLQSSLDEQYLKEKASKYPKQLYQALVKAAVDKNESPDKFNDIIKELINSDEIRNIRYAKFASLFSQQKDREISNLEYRITEHNRDIMSYENNIAKLATELREFNERLLYLKTKEDNDEEIMMLFKYLTKHKNIYKFDLTDRKLNIKWDAPIVYYTDYAIKKIIKAYKDKEVKTSILQLFLDKRFQLYTSCEIQFDPRTFGVRTKNLSYSECNYFGHPHINRFSCFGNHRQAIEESAKSSDYIGAIEQINQTVMNLNFYDTCVIEEMLRNLIKENSRKTWFDTKEKEFVTTIEAIRRSKEYETIKTDK